MAPRPAPPELCNIFTLGNSSPAGEPRLRQALKVVSPLPVELVPHDDARDDGGGGDDREEDEEEDHHAADAVLGGAAVLAVAAARRLEHALVRVEIEAAALVRVAVLAVERALTREWN